jgi:adenine-specific DNA-methyltransferase
MPWWHHRPPRRVRDADPMAKRKGKTLKQVDALKHDDASRKNIPTAEYQSLIEKENQTPIQVAYERRNRDLDPQLVWRGKDEQDWSDLVVPAPPLYIQEKVHPKVLIDDLLRRSSASDSQQAGANLDLFADFNGLPSPEARTEFYQHDQNWSNRMILGDSLQVMASLAEREGLRGKVQCIYVDPPYGIKFNSNFQWSTRSRDVTDGQSSHITREPEQVKAFRDTWREGIHSYLTYLRDRFTVARDLLASSGSVFVQIGDENVHRVRALMDEVFGAENFVSLITMTKTTSATSDYLPGVADYVIWFCKDKEACKYRQLYRNKTAGGDGAAHYSSVFLPDGRVRRATEEERAGKVGEDVILFTPDQLQSTGSHGSLKGAGAVSWFSVRSHGRTFNPTPQSIWKTSELGMTRLSFAGRLLPQKTTLRYVRRIDDFAAYSLTNVWSDIGGASDKRYIVETTPKIVERCILMASDPGDLVLDPTCGSGTTATVAEQWGRRWITIDTSRVALALARARIMGARYAYYVLADSREGQIKEAEITHVGPSSQTVRSNIRQGFVYERVPHVTLKAIANNTEIDVIWEKWQKTLEPLRERLNASLKTQCEEWEVPREADAKWPEPAKKLHGDWWQARIGRQKEIDASIAAKAEFEYLYDKPYSDPKKVRVAGPFTVESLSPHRVLGVDENDNVIDSIADKRMGYEAKTDFPRMIIENLRTAGVQQAHREDRITFTELTPWPGKYICADGRYVEGSGASAVERRAGIFIGPEFGTVLRSDLVDAAREAADATFDVLIACAFNFEAHTTEFTKLGRVPVLKARMNADLHMAEDLKNTGKGNLFVIFGEPDIDVLDTGDGQVQVKINGVDVFHPNTGEVRSDGPEGIACWFIDTDYNEESFFVRHAYFLGQNDPYGALKTTLKAEINEEAWATLHSDTSRPFPKPASGRIAVKVINHLGDEVMKVFRA